MSASTLILLVLGLGLAGWLVARSRAAMFRRANKGKRIASLPNYHAWYAALWIVIPTLLFALIWGQISDSLVIQHVLASPAAADLPAFGMHWLAPRLRDDQVAELLRDAVAGLISVSR